MTATTSLCGLSVTCDAKNRYVGAHLRNVYPWPELGKNTSDVLKLIYDRYLPNIPIRHANWPSADAILSSPETWADPSWRYQPAFCPTWPQHRSSTWCRDALAPTDPDPP